MTEYCYCSLSSDTSLHPVDPQLGGCTSLQAAFPMTEGFLSSERPSLAVCSRAQMSCNKSGSSPVMFTLYWIGVNCFRCPCIVFPTVSDSVLMGEGRPKVYLAVFTALHKAKGQVACKVSLSSRLSAPKHLQPQEFILFKVQAETKVSICQSHTVSPQGCPHATTWATTGKNMVSFKEPAYVCIKKEECLKIPARVLPSGEI